MASGKLIANSLNALHTTKDANISRQSHLRVFILVAGKKNLLYSYFISVRGEFEMGFEHMIISQFIFHCSKEWLVMMDEVRIRNRNEKWIVLLFPKRQTTPSKTNSQRNFSRLICDFHSVITSRKKSEKSGTPARIPTNTSTNFETNRRWCVGWNGETTHSVNREGKEIRRDVFLSIYFICIDFSCNQTIRKFLADPFKSEMLNTLVVGVWNIFSGPRRFFSTMPARSYSPFSHSNVIFNIRNVCMSVRSMFGFKLIWSTSPPKLYLRMKRT